MSGYYESDPDEGQETTGSGLRKVLEQVLEENKSLRKMLEGDKRADVVSEAVKDMGLDPAIAELIPQDEADPKKWLEDRAHLFGVKKANEPEVQTATEPEVVAPVEDDPALAVEREALEAMQGAAASGSSQTSVVGGDLIEQMNKITTEEELLAFFAKNGQV